jgi:integrase
MASIIRRDTTRGPRYDVRYRLGTGQVRTRTHRTKREAVTFAAGVETDRTRGGLVDPRAGKVTFAAYSADWLAHRPDLRPRTRGVYEGTLRLHIIPGLGRHELGKISPESVRCWRSDLIGAGAGAATVAKAYRLLRTILNTAVEDGRIVANPCRIKKGGSEKAAERPVVGPAEVWALADAVTPERRPMVLLAGFCGLRLGEVLALAVRHVDLLHGTVTVERQLQQLGKAGTFTFTDAKTDAAHRAVPLPASVATELRTHLEAIGATDPDALLFTGTKGGPLRRGVWVKEWDAARTATGNAGLRFHDLRHSALTLLAATGATVAELQAHAGHASPAAALRYQHATTSRGRALADLVDAAITASEPARTTVRAMDAR